MFRHNQALDDKFEAIKAVKMSPKVFGSKPSIAEEKQITDPATYLQQQRPDLKYRRHSLLHHQSGPQEHNQPLPLMNISILPKE